jgi:hypothetical protein
MPFKNVSQPRRVASVDGVLESGSYNRKLGSVAMISNNPVQVAVVGQNGSPAKVFGVQLDDVSDIALLSRDMAVVRSENQVWQLLDIAHKAKVDPLTNDVRSVVGPVNDAALALKWDNSIEQLTPGKNEVSSRSASLRGDHRAIDVGETECYAVVDDNGGEFRIHPGATPEQGSTAKVALPAGTKNLDRLRGGRFLSALYQRNNPDVCLIRRAGNRLEAKLVRLDVPVTDVVVVETSMIAVAKDGRVILYDGESIEKATSRIDAKHEMSLGCTGEPRCALVAHGHLFVGTSAGEVMLAVIVRKQGGIQI